MNRRDALKIVLTLFGGSVFGAPRLLANLLEGPDRQFALSSTDRALLDEISETIIPATPESGGAKAAHVVDFMQEIIRDFYSDQERSTFAAGLKHLQADIQAKYSGRNYGDLTPTERHELIISFEGHSPPPAFYRMIKQLTVWGYFTSEIGATQALAHVSVPGRFEGCITVGPETRGWSE